MPPTDKIPPDRRAPSGKPDDPDNPQAQDLTSGVELGEYASISGDPNDPQMIPTEDGGFVATIGEAEENPKPTEEDGFYANLAEEGRLPDSTLDTLSTDLLRKIEQDKEARAKRVEQYEMALRRTGLGKDAPGGAQFEGASRVVHPMITEACIDYNARIMKEIFPIAGPCKPKIVGVPTTQKTEKAERICEHMNWQLTTQIKEARGVLETTFTQVPLAGAEYVLQYWDHRLKRPRWQCVSIDKVYIPFIAADFFSAHRKTYSEDLPSVDFRQRVDQGMYRDWNLPKPSSRPEQNKAAQANDKIEGKDDSAENLDGDREIYTTMTYLEVTKEMAAALARQDEGGNEIGEQENELYPYLVSIDKDSKKILAIYRDWEEDDDAREAIEHLFEFGFIPWRGALSIGMGQIIDGLSGAATGALRALLDSAHANNALTAFVLKGAGISGQTPNPKIGTLTEIDGGLEAKSIRDLVMAPPFNPPSPVLFQLLGLLSELARGVVRTSMDETVDANSNVPVGTQLSRVEEGLVVFSAIHGRAHQALDRLLMGLHRLNRLYLPDELKVDGKGKEILVRREDYEGPCDVQPVSDPTIYSDQQRFAQITALEQSALQFPNMYNMRAIQKRKLALWKVQDPDEILIDQPAPHELNAINENLAMAMGRPVVAFPEQDHIAHLQALCDFMASPLLGSNPLIAPAFLPLALKHAAEHIAYYYVHTIVDAVTNAAGMPAHELMSNDVKVKAMYDQLLAEASSVAMPNLADKLQGALPIIQQAMQLLKSMQPPPPMDPALAAVQAASAETGRKSQDDQAGHALDVARLEAEKTKDQGRIAVDWARIQTMVNDAALAAHTKILTTKMNNAAAEEISDEKIESGQGSHLTDGGGFTH